MRTNDIAPVIVAGIRERLEKTQPSCEKGDCMDGAARPRDYLGDQTKNPDRVRGEGRNKGNEKVSLIAL